MRLNTSSLDIHNVVLKKLRSLGFASFVVGWRLNQAHWLSGRDRSSYHSYSSILPQIALSIYYKIAITCISYRQLKIFELLGVLVLSEPTVSSDASLPTCMSNHEIPCYRVDMPWSHNHPSFIMVRKSWLCLKLVYHCVLSVSNMTTAALSSTYWQPRHIHHTSSRLTKHLPCSQHQSPWPLTTTSQLSMNLHVDTFLESCGKTLCTAYVTCRPTQAHGMSDDSIQEVFRFLVIAQLVYASQAWSGFCTAGDFNKLDQFLTKCKRLNYCSQTIPSITERLDNEDQSLFRQITLRITM